MSDEEDAKAYRLAQAQRLLVNDVDHLLLVRELLEITLCNAPSNEALLVLEQPLKFAGLVLLQDGKVFVADHARQPAAIRAIDVNAGRFVRLPMLPPDRGNPAGVPSSLNMKVGDSQP